MTTNNRRLTANSDSNVVVFLIGMRINRWWKVWQWLRIVGGMSRMLRELAAHPELGLLSAESWFGRTTLMVSYWKSTDHLLSYAKSRNAQHLPAWRAFNRYVGTNGDVGIWHETYRASAAEYETVYVNMPAFGLGKANGLREATGRHASAADRLRQPVPDANTAALTAAE